MNRNVLRRFVLFATWLTTPLLASADTLSLKVENDIIASGSDGHYSNGLEVIWGFEPQPLHWSRNFADILPGWSSAALDNVALRFGHQIYTPDQIEIDGLIENDRPYAGLMFAGLSLFADTRREGWRSTQGLHLDAGIVGPAAGGKRLQRVVHHITDSDEPNGWDHQLHNEPFVNLAYQHRWWLQHRLGGLELEYGPSLGFALGNLYTFASAGLGMRLGRNLDRSFSIPAVTPAQSGTQFFRPGPGFGWYGFANLEGRYMAQNMLLDGNTFEDSHSVDRREWVGDAKLGVALTWTRWQLAFASVWRTHEFEGQQKHDQFGSITLSTWL
ncbi:lipid A deacylase LpxR family protein [Stutzerimonas stutzeri]|uniref:lipid A deacylase LpxR family protein n=1 Tax=Stutzerimonas sp. S1 TaxID=3030652 RepID=UPI00222566DC|nr:lipid A deacylase LpxR family protein [Stutzerimonas sp. S1]MCW3148950.1 lipid A deacylase LpxR family protein [Stutzerimonas sp. S1]